MRRCVLSLAAWLTFILLSTIQSPGDALDIIAPKEAETVVARSDAQGLRVRVDLGVDVHVPEHGFLALYLDSTRVLLACPGSVASASDCPSAGEPISGEISLGLGNMPSGEHVLSVELLDASLAPLAIARRVFTYMEASEEDGLLPSGSSDVCHLPCVRAFSLCRTLRGGMCEHRGF